MEGQVAGDLRLVVLEGEPLDTPLLEELVQPGVKFLPTYRRKPWWKKQRILGEHREIALDVVLADRRHLGVDHAVDSLLLLLTLDLLSHVDSPLVAICPFFPRAGFYVVRPEARSRQVDSGTPRFYESRFSCLSIRPL